MQITADMSEIWKLFQRDLTFILNDLSESSIHFAYFSIAFAKKYIDSFFIENEAVLLWVTMRERARAFAATI